MNEEKKYLGRRPETRVALYAEKWLMGSIRREFTLEERSVFADLLTYAGLHGGEIVVAKNDNQHMTQLAGMFLVPPELVVKTIQKSLKLNKMKRKYIKSEKKYVYFFTKWKQFQPPYLWGRPPKSQKKIYASHEPGTKIKKDKEKKNEIILNKNKQKDQDVFIEKICNQYQTETKTEIETDNAKRQLKKIIDEGEDQKTIIETVKGYFDFLDEKKSGGFDQKPKAFQNFLHNYKDMKKLYHGHKRRSPD